MQGSYIGVLVDGLSMFMLCLVLCVFPIYAYGGVMWYFGGLDVCVNFVSYIVMMSD